MPIISIISPCYFNQDSIPILTQRLIENEINFPNDVQFEYIFVDDGSEDNTWEQLLIFRQAYPHKVKLIRFVKNFGALNASFAGLAHAKGNCLVVIAADLQDPPELIARMYQFWIEGEKLVLVSRNHRNDGFFTDLFAFFANKLTSLYLKNYPKNGYDLILMDSQIRNNLIAFDCRNVAWNLLVLDLGFPYKSIVSDREVRKLGVSKWTFSKKLKFFIDNVFAFSNIPLYTILFLSLINLGMLYFITITNSMIYLLSSTFILISFLIIVIYLKYILNELRKKPRYIIKEFLD